MMFKYMCLVLFITWYQLADCHPAGSDIKSIDSMIDKESEAFLSAEANESSQKTVRDKRTIGFLRQLFPNFSQIVDRKIQQITRFLFRVIGRLVLRGGAGGGAGAGGATAGGGGSEAGGSGGRRISITLPTFPPSADDEDEDAATEAPTAATPESVESRASDAADTTSLPLSVATDSAAAASADSLAADTATASPTAAAVTTDAPATTAATTAAAAAITTTNAGTTNAAAAVTTNSPATTQRPSDSDNTVGTVMKRTAREASTEETSSAQKRSPLTDTENNEVSSDNGLQNTDEAQADTEEDPRNKRFLLNLRGGGGGGSGNFLFDLIRLVAGSGANQDREESPDAVPLEAEAQEVRADLNGKEDGYSVGVPGPLTRIFVIANRGVANLVQDLILRLAQTTERIVNFKARLITSLI